MNPNTTTDEYRHAPAADHHDGLIAVPAGELRDWARLTGLLAEWLTFPARATTTDYQQRFTDSPTLPTTGWMLHTLTERIHTLLESDRRHP